MSWVSFVSNGLLAGARVGLTRFALATLIGFALATLLGFALASLATATTLATTLTWAALTTSFEFFDHAAVR